MQNSEFARSFLSEIEELCGQIDTEAISATLLRLIHTWQVGGCVYAIGNGGSASTASHFVCDMCKYVVPQGKAPFNAICLSDNVALFTAWANDANFDDVYVRQIENRIGVNDVLVSFSVHGGSGFSRNLVKAVGHAKEQGAFTVSFSGFDGGLLGQIADCSIVVPKDSTPHVEAMHVVLTHLLAARLRQKLEEQE